MYAKMAAMFITAWCEKKWPGEGYDKGARMGSTMANGPFIDCFDHTGHGTHKYICADKLTEDLGEKQGAGVYAFWSMKDGSKLLLTCNGRLAYWSGKDEDKACWAD